MGSHFIFLLTKRGTIYRIIGRCPANVKVKTTRTYPFSGHLIDISYEEDIHNLLVQLIVVPQDSISISFYVREVRYQRALGTKVLRTSCRVKEYLLKYLNDRLE